ncbi:MAG: peptidylprolyl isomerase [Bacteroidales bacterium]|nr:peptidylprolyl isomerase [Bacteroidales bacterium]
MRKTFAFLILLAAAAIVSAQNGSASTPSDDEPVVDKVVAVVGKNIVKLSDIENGYVPIRIRQGYEKAFENRCNILEGLLITKLLIHKGQIDSTDAEITDDEINSSVQYYISAYERQYGSKEAMRQATGYTYDEMKDLLKKMIRERMLSERVQSQLTSTVKITPREVTEYFAKIPADSVPLFEETYEIAEIVRKPEINEDERDRVRLELNKMRERILKGEVQFSTLATLYSEDPGSASKGGELGFFTRGFMVAEFEAAAFALKPGEVSPVVETQFGFHLIQLIERRGNAINCRHILMMPKVSSEDLLRNRMLLDSIAQQIRLGRTTFADAAARFSDNANKIEGGKVTHPTSGGYQFTLDELKQLYPGIGFSQMNAGEISNATAMKTDDNKDAYRIVTVIRRNPAHKANLTDDYDRIYNAALENARQEKIFDWAQKTIKNTYIHIDDEFKDCSFRLKWVE